VHLVEEQHRAPTGRALFLYPHISPSDCTGFEDTLKGITALQLAGIRPILICDPSHPQIEGNPGITHYPSLKDYFNLMALDQS
jgi:beta-phosphoglucomutase-like phosphatase (HAD superfamily)